MTKFNKIGAVVATAITMAMAAPANAQGIPVIDPGNIAQTVRVVQQGVQQIQKAEEQLRQITTLTDTIGKIGQGNLSQILGQVGLSFDQADSALREYRSAIPGLIDSLPNARAAQGLNIDQNLARQSLRSIQSGRQFALNTFYQSGNATADQVNQRRGLREAAMRDSLTAGYAMAVYTKNDLANVETTMQGLTRQVSAAQDLRGDVQGNSAIGLAQLRQLAVQNQLLAQLLEVQSSAAMANNRTEIGGEGQ